MPKLKTSGFERFWPLKELTGRNMAGNKLTREIYRNMVTGEIHAPEDGWNGSPPDFPSGEKEPVISASDAYRENYDRIFKGGNYAGKVKISEKILRDSEKH